MIDLSATIKNYSDVQKMKLPATISAWSENASIVFINGKRLELPASTISVLKLLNR